MMNKTICQLFEEQVKKNPDNTALIFKDKRLSYTELHKNAEQLAWTLRKEGTERGTVVAIMVDRSFEMITGLLAILMAGGAYLPIDPSFPADRIEYMLKDSGAKLLLTDRTPVNFDSFTGKVLDIRDKGLYPAEAMALEDTNTADDLAYIMYTSGSTGKPKGTLISNRNITRVVKNTNYIKISENDTILQLSNYAFDGSTFDIYGALLNGAGLVLVEKDTVLDVAMLSKIIEKEKITIFFVTTALFNAIVDVNISCLKNVRKVLFGGEKASVQHVKKALSYMGRDRIIHVYGPTESTVFATYYPVNDIDEQLETIPIGKPISRTSVFILNDSGQLQSIGLPGELCISGDGLSKGYLNMPELTKEKFVPNPIIKGKRMYKTGDIAKWLPDGNIVFIGRQDQQVKIRGFRIELGEIENRLIQFDAVKQALVVAKENAGGEYLCAYLVCSRKIQVSELRQYLSKVFPNYMIPSYFVFLDKMPLTPNGKIDKKHLPEPELNAGSSEGYLAPSNENESALIQVLQDLLGIDGIGVNDNFFEIGGDSIRAIQVASRLADKGLKLEIKELLRQPTLKMAAATMVSERVMVNEEAVCGDVPLTPIQKWFFQNDPEHVNHFNQSTMLFRKEGFDENIVKTVFSKIVEHHDALRMQYRLSEGKFIQTDNDCSASNACINLEVIKDADTSEIEKTCDRLQRQMNIFEGRMLQLALFKTDKGDHLFIAVHHLVMDGVSWRIMLKDFAAGYRKALENREIDFQRKTSSYKRWAEALNSYAEKSTLLNELDYWAKIEKTEFESLPAHPYKSNLLKDCDEISITFSNEETDNLLHHVNRAYGTEINDTLLTALALALNEQTGLQHIWIDLEGHGRESFADDIDVSRTVGWFTSLYPVVLNVNSDMDLSQEIKSVKETLRRIPNKGMGYGVLKYLTNKTKIPEGMFRVKPEIGFNYFGQFDNGSNSSLFEISPLKTGTDMSPESKRAHLLDINGKVIKSKLTLIFSYNRYSFDKEAMERLAHSFEKYLKKIIFLCMSVKENAVTSIHNKELSSEEMDLIRRKFGENIQKIYPLSPTQEGMLFHAALDRNSRAYFEQICVSVEGELSLESLQKSFTELFQSYDVLRTVFIHEGLRSPMQVVLKSRPSDIKFVDISDRENKQEYIDEFIKQDAQRGIDLQNDPVMRMAVIKSGANRYELLWSFHHIVLDGWCISLVFGRLFDTYKKLENNIPVLKEEKIGEYQDYIQWLERQNKESARRYWKKYLDGYETEAILPGKFNNINKTGFVLGETSFEIDESLTKKLSYIARSNKVTLNTVFQAIWGILLQKYNNTNDVVFGAVVSGRPVEIKGIEKMVGLFVNTIPVRVKCDKENTFRDLLRKMQKNAIESEKYHYSSLAEIQADTVLKKGLVNHILGFQNYPIKKELSDDKPSKKGLRTLKIKINEQTNYDFSITVFPDKKLAINIIYNQSMFDSKIISMIKGHIENTLNIVASNPDIHVGDIDILTENEIFTLLRTFNDCTTDYGRDKTLQSIFEQQAAKNPEHVAVVYQDEKLTYRQLNERANQLAWMLRQKGVKKGSIVGIIEDRSIDMIVDILGILKAGGAYLPIDPTYPSERISGILKDSGASLVLTQSSVIKNIPFTSLLNIDDTADIKKIVTAQRPQITDLDNHPFPDRSLVNYNKYINFIGMGHVKNAFAIQMTRGCPYNCAYCHKIWPKSHQVRSAENLFEEVKYLYDAGVRRFTVVDDIFNLNIKNSSQFFKLILKNKLKADFFFPNGVRGDILTADYIDLMIEAGTKGLSLALETASPRLQKLIGKNLNIDKLKANLDYITAKHPEIILDLFWMIGFPTETEEEAMSTLNFVKSIRWLHFPVLSILKIYPNTDMEKIALQNGVSMDAIKRSCNMAYQEMPETLPFSKGFAGQIQTSFLYDYFLSKERLNSVLDVQRRIFDNDELLQKYNSYLPQKVNSIQDIMKMAGVENYVPNHVEPPKPCPPIDLDKLIRHPTVTPKKKSPLRILLIDLSQYFTGEDSMLYNVAEAPLGLMYLLTYLNKHMGDKIEGKILKSRFDFNSFPELKKIIDDFKPDVIGLRALTLYKNFFHKTISCIRQWGVDVPIIVGGPYATSDYNTILNDKNIDIVVRGEGEITLYELMCAFLDNNKKLPCESVLREIKGIAFVENKEQAFSSKAAKIYPEIVMLDAASETLARCSRENPENLNNADDIAYVMYTSGSTGKPKGNLTMHHNITRVVKNTNYINITPDDSLLQLSNYAFDGSVFDIFGALLNGAKLVLLNKDILLNIDRLSEIIKEEKISVFFVTTALFNTLVDINISCFSNIRKVLFGGERVSVHHVKKALEYMGPGKIIHVYGPTESTVFATYYPVDTIDERLGTIPIGKPISNTSVYILGDDNSPRCIGVAGELCISGDGLAKGYLNKPELNSQKFVDNPFVKGERLYRTGDLARWLPDGNIEFLGRMDQQVKLRGFRIELGEIEAQLLKHEDIKEAVVTAIEEKNGRYLCAYIVSDRNFTAQELKEYLEIELPDFMVPSNFIKLDSLPLNSSGKVDIKRLPKPRGYKNAGTGYEAPRNETEERLAAIWCEVLDLEKVGINDNFFELGGHSLKATVLVSKIHKEFGVKIPLKEVFNFFTVKGQARFIENAKKTKYLPIRPVETKEYYAVSSAQKRLYILNRLSPSSTAYNVSLAVRIDGDFDKNRFENAIELLVKRHEAFRTSFEMVDSEPVQIIHDNVNIPIEYSECGIEELDGKIREFIRLFDLAKAPLLRVGLIKISPSEQILLIDIHHIISDGVSLGIFMKEFGMVYSGHSLSPLTTRYRDFSAWQNDLLKTDKVKKQEEYWINKFKGDVPVLGLPTDYQRPVIQSFEGDNLRFSIGKNLTQKIKKLASETSSTLYMVLLAAYNVLLYKYTGKQDIVVGSPIAGRQHADLENVIGIFINTLAMRNQPCADKTFKQFLGDVKENTLKALENQDCQFEELIDKLNINRDVGRNPLFDTMFVLENVNIEIPYIDGLKFKPYELNTHVSKFDISLIAVENDGDLEFTVEYCTKLFKKDSMERFINHFKSVLQQITQNSDAKLYDIDILTAEERNNILHDFNETKASYPDKSTICDLFEAQVEKTPDNTAVIFDDITWTYQELNERSNSLARKLRKEGVTRGNIVGIMVERSPYMIAGIMAILKAGGAYMPISPEYPDERIRFMLQDSGTSLLLAQSRFSGINAGGTKILSLDDESLYSEDNSNLDSISAPGDPAYVIYTSGSTGEPKGVIIAHYSLVNRLCWMQKAYPIGYNDVILQKTPFTFDVSVWELLWWSMCGASVCFLKQGEEKNPEAIVNAVEKYRITTMHFVPSMLAAFLEYIGNGENLHRLNSLRQIFASGEALNAQHVKMFNKSLRAANGTRLYNLYGPTEAAIDVSHYDCPDGEEIEVVPIGKPIDNIRLYILDERNNLQPIGVPGELHISGDGLSLGYLNKPELTKKQFIENPFEPGQKMYKTGDLARWLPDGNIEYLGRIDNQVKLRGIRIELGEIEKALLKIDFIKEAAVVLKDDKTKSKYLCAFFTSDKNADGKEIKELLAQILPLYMIPSCFVRLEKLPLTSNGKLDRRTLEMYEIKMVSEKYTAPENEVQQEIASVWQTVLGVDKISIYDDFFEAGGNSIKAIKVMTLLEDLNLNFNDIFRYPTIAELSRHVKQTEKTGLSIANSNIRLSDIMKKRLNFEFYYDRNGNIDDYLRLLNCYQLATYFIAKEKCGHMDKRYEAFFNGIGMKLTQVTDGKNYGIILDTETTNNGIFKFNIHYGKGSKALSEVEKLLDKGEMVMIQTYNIRVPFSPIYKSPDAVNDNIESSHVFLAVGYDSEYLFYVEIPWTVNVKNHVWLQENKSIGVIKKEKMFPAFDKLLNYITVEIDEQKLSNTDSVFSHAIEQSILNFSKKSEIKDNRKVFYGLEAIETLIKDFENGKIHMNKSVPLYDTEQYVFLKWGFYSIVNLRKQLYCALKDRAAKHAGSTGATMDVLKKTIECWDDIILYVNSAYNSGNYVPGVKIQELLVKVKGLEANLNNCLKENLPKLIK